MYIYSHNDNKKKNGFKLFFTVLLTVLFTVVIIENIIILLGSGRNYFAVERLSTDRTSSFSTSSTYNSALAGDIPYMIENVKESTVGISLLKPDGESMLDIDVAQKWGMGTGIIVSKNGYILTNQHLAQNVGARLVITLHDGTVTQGKVIWNEKNIDLAIIKIDEKNLKVANFRKF